MQNNEQIRNLFLVHRSSFTIHHSPFTIHHSSFIIHHSSFIIHHSSFIIHHSEKYMIMCISRRQRGIYSCCESKEFDDQRRQLMKLVQDKIEEDTPTKNPLTKRIFSLVVSGLWLALTLSQIAFGAQEPKAKNLNSALTQTTVTAQESRVTDPDAARTSTGFTYQGQLKDANGPVTGAFDFQFILYSAQTGGERLGANEMNDMALTNGLFNFKLNFGRAALETKESWLEIGVRPNGSTDDYTLLFPRQKLTPTPYAIFAQHEQWSLIGVPVGFVRSVDKAAVITDEIADQGVTDAKKISEETAKSSDSLKKATDAESNAAAPQGTVGRIAKFDTGTTLGDSIISQSDSGNIGIGGVPDTRLAVNSSAPNSQAVLTVSNGGNPADTRLGLWSGFSAGANPPAILYTHDLRFLGAVAGANFATGAGFAEVMRITRNSAVGIGTTAPTAGVRLEVNGTTRVTPGGSGGVVQFGTPGGETGIAIFGNNRADVRFDGSTLKLLAGIGPGAMPSTNGIAINTAGNVGIGTVSPTSKLEIAAQDGLAITGFQPFLTLRDANAGGKSGFVQSLNGDVLLLTNSRKALIVRDSDGLVSVKVLQVTGADIAEPFDITGHDVIQSGMVVAIDPTQPGHLRVAHTAYDRTVAGIISGANGINPGVVMKQDGTLADGSHPVALTGRVYCWADASYGAIEPGDFLTTSDVPGHAMKVTDHAKAQGAIIGKAMTELKQGKGLVLVLVTLQ
jgi:hypothetical protein